MLFTHEIIFIFGFYRNRQTIKGVNFFGPCSEFIMSGSDCGNIFLWDKNTESIVQWLPGDDRGIVNCLEGNHFFSFVFCFVAKKVDSRFFSYPNRKVIQIFR